MRFPDTYTPCPSGSDPTRVRSPEGSGRLNSEAGADRLDRWDEAALADAELDLGALRAEAEEVEPELARNARLLAAKMARHRAAMT